MESIIVKPNSEKTIKIDAGKVGFLWEIISNTTVWVEIDGIPTKCGQFNPPYLVTRKLVVKTSSQSNITYKMEVFDDMWGEKSSNVVTETDKYGDFMKTEPRRPKSGHIQNYVLNTANHWYEINIPKNVLSWSLRLRENYNLLYAYDPSHVTYSTLQSGETVTEDTSPNKGINAIYVMCETAGTTVEFEVWIDGNY